MRILFMGTPDIAAACLSKLLLDGKEVVGVISQPDKPKGRGYTLTPPPVKVLAQEHGIPEKGTNVGGKWCSIVGIIFCGIVTLFYLFLCFEFIFYCFCFKQIIYNFRKRQTNIVDVVIIVVNYK